MNFAYKNRKKRLGKTEFHMFFVEKTHSTTIWEQKDSMDFEIKSRILFGKKGFSIKKKMISDHYHGIELSRMRGIIC